MVDPEVRANALLVSLLDDRQRDEWHARRTVTVRGPKTGYRYRLTCQYVGGIEVLDKRSTDFDGAIGILCVHAGSPLGAERFWPIADHLVAQLLALRCDEHELLAVAVPNLRLPDDLCPLVGTRLNMGAFAGPAFAVFDNAQVVFERNGQVFVEAQRAIGRNIHVWDMRPLAGCPCGICRQQRARR